MKQAKYLNTAIKVMPFAFAFHNIEEAWHISDSNQEGVQLPFIVNSVQFIIAVSLFTILGFFLVLGKKYYTNNKSYLYIITGFSGMLFLNSFFPHILSAFYLKAYTSGLVSAIIILLPLSFYILWSIRKLHAFSTKQYYGTIVAGAIVGIVLVFLFLGIGYIASSSI